MCACVYVCVYARAKERAEEGTKGEETYENGRWVSGEALDFPEENLRGACGWERDGGTRV